MGALVVGAVAIGVADLWLLVISWRSRTVLAGVLGAVGIGLVAVAVALGPKASYGKGVLVIAFIVLVLGVVPYLLGRALERLLEQPCNDDD